MTDATARIDAHHHFWDPARYSYPWMAGDAMAPVRLGLHPHDLRGPLGEERIDGTVLVQTLSSPRETREFLHVRRYDRLCPGRRRLGRPDLARRRRRARRAPRAARTARWLGVITPGPRRA